MPQIPILSFSSSERTPRANLDVHVRSILAFVAPVPTGMPVRFCGDALGNERKGKLYGTSKKPLKRSWIIRGYVILVLLSFLFPSEQMG